MDKHFLCVIAVIVATPAVAAEFHPDRIVLSSGGLAEISAAVPVSGHTVVELDAPLAQVDDVLKSLVIQGEGVSIVSVDLAGREPLSDTFASLPFTPADLENSITLLSALKGVSVEVRRNDRALRGVVIGVEIVAASDAAERAGPSARLAIATEASAIEHVEIDAATRVTILDETMQAAMLDALHAIAMNRSADHRTIAITLDGPASARAVVTYVVGAPVWKPAWRIVLPAGEGSVRLQGWAVLENRSGLDWNGVALTLSSGTPVALTQTLYDSVTVPRPEVPLQVGQRIRPDMDRGAMPAAAAPAAKSFGEAEGAFDLAAAASSQRYSGGGLAAGPAVAATETLAAATFRIPGTVDLAVGRSLTLPFFDGEATVTRVSVFQPGVSDRHPIAAVRVTNDSPVTLPGGIVTVYEALQSPSSDARAQDAVDFVGDAEFSGAAPGEERILAYALDAKVTVAADAADQSIIRTARVEDGLLVVEYGRTRKTVYRLQGDPNAGRSLLIEHMAYAGWSVETDARIEGRDGDRVRIVTELGAGEARAVNVTETTIDAQRWSLLETPDEIILDLLAVGDRIDPRLREPLRRIAQIRTQSAEYERTIEQVDEAIERIREDQERVRDNLSAVDKGGDLARTYLDRLQRQEAEMGRLEQERDAASDALAAARTELSELVKALAQ